MASERDDLIEELRAVAEDRHGAKNTHLLSWLEKGYFHCQHGGEKWCQGDYLDSAKAYIERLEAISKDALATISRLEAAVEAGVRATIVPLEWVNVGDPCYRCKAKTLFGRYDLWRDDAGYTFSLSGRDCPQVYASEDEAKAAAQEDFASKARSLLAPPRTEGERG